MIHVYGTKYGYTQNPGLWRALSLSAQACGVTVHGYGDEQEGFPTHYYQAKITDMIRYLEQTIRNHRGKAPISAIELFESQRSRRAMICLFLAILELVKRQAILLTQGEAFGDIGLKKNRAFDEVFAPDQSLAAIEQEYS